MNPIEEFEEFERVNAEIARAIADAQLTGELPGVMTSRYAVRTYHRIVRALMKRGFEVSVTPPKDAAVEEVR